MRFLGCVSNQWCGISWRNRRFGHSKKNSLLCSQHSLSVLLAKHSQVKIAKKMEKDILWFSHAKIQFDQHYICSYTRLTKGDHIVHYLRHPLFQCFDFLPSGRRWWKDDAEHHCSSFLLCVHAAGGRKFTSNFWFSASYW